MGRPGLVGTMARTAVVAGTATAVAGNVQRRQQTRADNKAAEEAESFQQEQAYQEPAPVAPAAPAPSPPAESSQDVMLEQLAKLGQLKQAGLIDDAEFSAAKAKVLGI
ncbi:SHOCT domain-containing protein [Glaciihabitans tibetensis]|nr:SHOCT domain-containing protein [Glaciihabitans tibetensis]